MLVSTHQSWSHWMFAGLMCCCFGFGVVSIGVGQDEARLLAEVEADELARHAREIVRHVRDGGSPGEYAAVDYVVSQLRADGITVEVHSFPAYVSDPGACALRVDGAEPSTPTCKTQALAAATTIPISGELVDVGRGQPEDYAGADVEGKIALVNDLPLPDGVSHAERAGAIGAVFTSYSELIQELTVSPIWGTPNHKNYEQLPSIPTININKPDGDALREAVASRAVRVTIETSVDRGWKTLRLPVATIPSARDPEGYVLVGGHIDGWHYGAVDEGASNAAMVEMARIFHRHTDELERGLKLAWWPAHSNGRYAGSAWFVDETWMDLKTNALAYMNIDGVGQIGASIYGSSNTASMDALAQSVFEDVADVDARRSRPGRNSDQGFYGVGLPLLQFNHGRDDPGGRYWFWHTEEDTLDKIDFDILAGDTRLYVSALSRLLTAPVPPIELQAAAKELHARVVDLREQASSHLELQTAIDKASELVRLTETLDATLGRLSESERSAEISRAMVSVLRPILRVTYQENGPYHQDPALSVPKLPGFRDLAMLSEQPRESDLYGFTRTHLIREKNRLEDQLSMSIAAAQSLQLIVGSEANQ